MVSGEKFLDRDFHVGMSLASIKSLTSLLSGVLGMMALQWVSFFSTVVRKSARWKQLSEAKGRWVAFALD